ncbi:MAG: GNAT family N-acetyltransferase [Alphaproteobacteria bacterium]
MNVIRTNGDAVHGVMAAGLSALLDDAYGHPLEPGQIELPKAAFRLLVMNERQTVVAHLAAYKRDVTIGGHGCSIGMLGSAAVASEHRRRGL